MTTTTTDADVARWVSDFGRWVFEQLDELGAALQAPLSAPSPRRTDLDIEDWCHALLTDPRCPVAGAGAVMAPGVLADAAYWLEWWTVETRGGATTVSSSRRRPTHVPSASVTTPSYLGTQGRSSPGTGTSPARTSTTSAPTSTR